MVTKVKKKSELPLPYVKTNIFLLISKWHFGFYEQVWLYF